MSDGMNIGRRKATPPILGAAKADPCPSKAVFTTIPAEPGSRRTAAPGPIPGLLHPAPAAARDADAELVALLAEADQHFAAGNRAAGAGRLADAATAFEAALLRYRRAADGLEADNGYLLYNIGNTYFQLGDVGRAIHAYREAQRLIPGDRNLAQSLRHARSVRIDQIEGTAGGSIARVLFVWHFVLPLRTRLWACLIGVNVLWVVLAAWLVAGPTLRRPPWRNLAIALIAVAGAVTVAGSTSIVNVFATGAVILLVQGAQ